MPDDPVAIEKLVQYATAYMEHLERGGDLRFELENRVNEAATQLGLPPPFTWPPTSRPLSVAHGFNDSIGGVAAIEFTVRDGVPMPLLESTRGQVLTLLRNLLAEAEIIKRRVAQQANVTGGDDGRSETRGNQANAATVSGNGLAGVAAGPCCHSNDFTLVSWYGTVYTFASDEQSSVVRALWEEWKNGRATVYEPPMRFPGVVAKWNQMCGDGTDADEETFPDSAGAEHKNIRMEEVFRDHPAFGTMIRRCGDGKYALVPPAAKAEANDVGRKSGMPQQAGTGGAEGRGTDQRADPKAQGKLTDALSGLTVAAVAMAEKYGVEPSSLRNFDRDRTPDNSQKAIAAARTLKAKMDAAEAPRREKQELPPALLGEENEVWWKYINLVYAITLLPNGLQSATRVSAMLDRYTALRGAMFAELAKFRQAKGAPWSIQYKRDPEKGDCSLPPRSMTRVATGGKVMPNAASLPQIDITFAEINAFETYAPFHDFRIIDKEGHDAPAGSEAFRIGLSIKQLLQRLLDAVREIVRCLYVLRVEAVFRQCATDTTALVRLWQELPVFPYWPGISGMAAADFDQVLAAEKPVIDAAKETLIRLAAESVRFVPASAGAPQEAADPGEPNRRGNLQKRRGETKYPRRGKRQSYRRPLTRPKLVVDKSTRTAKWGATTLRINAHADFMVLQKLVDEDGKVVSHLDLLQAVKPAEIGGSVQSLKEAPQEIKDAVSHIRSAFKDVKCPRIIKAIRGRGYRLLSPDE